MQDQQQMRRNVIYNTVGNLVFFACQYLTNLLVVWLGGYEDAGLLSTAMTIASVCLSFSCYGMRTFQVSDFAHKYADRTYLVSRYITLAVAGGGCLVFALANSYSTGQRLVIFAYTAYRLIEAWVDVWHGYLQRAERMDLVGISFGVRGIVSAVSFAVGLLTTGNLFFTLLLMTALNLASAVLVDRRQGAARADFHAPVTAGVQKLLWECAPLALYSFLNTLVSSVPKYFCERMLGTVQMGYFNSIFAPAAIIQVGATYLFVPFITTFAHLWADRQGKTFRKGIAIVLGALAALWAVGTVGVVLLGRWGLSVLYYGKPEILDYTNLLQPLIGATVVTTLVLVLCHLLTIMREMRGLIAGNLAGIAASAVASPLLIDRFGIYGVAYATLVAMAVQSLVLAGFLVYRSRRHFANEAE